MGSWGVGLYSDDTTCEVRDEFKAHLQSGLSHSAAEKAILARFAELLSDRQVACLVYFALADTEWRFGCLSNHVKDQALTLLAQGGDVKYWQADSPSDARARARTLEALRVRLSAEQPPLKAVQVKLAKQLRKQLNSPVGSVFGLALPNGNTAALKFVGLRPVGSLAQAVFRLLPWQGHGTPSQASLEAVSDQAVTVSDHHEFSILMDGRKKPTAHLSETGVVLADASPMDLGRWVAVGIEVLPQAAQDALARLHEAPPEQRDCDDPEVDAQWCAARRQEVAEYLQGEGLVVGPIGSKPAWHVAPYVSVWAVESLVAPGSVGWWAISGDMPNDYVSAESIASPREAVRAIATLWQEAALCMSRGEKHPTFRIGSGDQDQELAPMLASRSELLLEWVGDAEAWDDGDT